MTRDELRVGQLVRVVRFQNDPRYENRIGYLYALSHYPSEEGREVIKARVDFFYKSPITVHSEDLELVLEHPQSGCSECAACGQQFSHNLSFFLRTGQHELCPECVGLVYTQCALCGEFTPNDQIITDQEGIAWCPTCHEIHSVACDECGQLLHGRIYTTVERGNLCRSCLSHIPSIRCAACGRYILDLNTNLIIDGEGHDGEIEVYYCRDCVDRIPSIRSYSYKPVPKFKKTDYDSNTETPLFLGVELEVDEGCHRELRAKEVKELLPFIYCKYDGSLDCGFEIVTHPCTLSYHTNQKEKYNQAFQLLKDAEFDADYTSTCGLHVHINRDFFGYAPSEIELGEAKLLYLSEKFWDRLAHFSRRTSTAIEQWAARVEDYDFDDSMIENLQKVKYQDRYHALNFENTQTIEFRIFKGTLKIETFLATLQFVDRLVRFTHERTPEELQEAKWSDLFEDLNNCEELVGYLQNRGLLSREYPLLIAQ